MIEIRCFFEIGHCIFCYKEFLSTVSSRTESEKSERYNKAGRQDF